MNIYDAIMKAADHIERHPDRFDYESVYIPGDTCSTPGCAVGWIAHFRGIRETGATMNTISQEALGLSFWKDGGFDDRMTELASGKELWWKLYARDCAITLRLYAAKYHAPKVSPPDWNAMAAKQTVSTEAVSQELVS